MDSKIEDVDLTKQKTQNDRSVTPTYSASTGNSDECSGNSSDTNSSDGLQTRSSSSDEMEAKKSNDSRSNDEPASNESRSIGSSGSDDGSSNQIDPPRESRRHRKARRWTTEDEEAEVDNRQSSIRMPRPIVKKSHPTWDCKREGCRGTLTLIGRVDNHCQDVESAKSRAKEMRKLYPATYVHGSLLSCNQCGDRPKNGSRYATWQRLCQICGEPYAMNGFWRMHGGWNNKNMESALEYRAPLHKKKLLESKWDAKSIANVDSTLAAEKKYLILAHRKMIESTTSEISDASIDRFEGTYETYAVEGYEKSHQKKNGGDKTTTWAPSSKFDARSNISSSSTTSDVISTSSSSSPIRDRSAFSSASSLNSSKMSTSSSLSSSSSPSSPFRGKRGSIIKRGFNGRRRARNRVQLEPGKIPTTHPLLSCKREGCAADVTLLGNVKTHFESLEECRKRATAMTKLYPQTFFHGSCLTCEECGDRPRVGTNGRHASWQRLCRICGEAYAMNGFWRSHGGCNNQNVSAPLHLRSSIHKSNMRKQWKQSAIESLEPCLNAEKAWLRVASKDTNFRLRGEIKDVDIITAKVSRMSTSNVSTAPKRHRSVSDSLLLAPHSSSMKRGNFVMNGKGTDEMRLAGESLAMLSAVPSLNSNATSVGNVVQPVVPMFVTQQQQQWQHQVPARSHIDVPAHSSGQTTSTSSWQARDFLPVLGHFVQIYIDGDWHRACIAKLEGGFVHFFLPNLAITKKISLPNDDLVLRPDFGFSLSQQHIPQQPTSSFTAYKKQGL